jgi:hypothetical protein
MCRRRWELRMDFLRTALGFPSLAGKQRATRMEGHDRGWRRQTVARGGTNVRKPWTHIYDVGGLSHAGGKRPLTEVEAAEGR